MAALWDSEKPHPRTHDEACEDAAACGRGDKREAVRGSGILRGTNRIAAIRIVPTRALQDSAYKSPDVLSEYLPYWDKVRMNKYDLAHQFANVIKQIFLYIKNRAGESANLKFGAMHLKVRFVLFQYVPYRRSTFHIVAVRFVS